MKLRWFLLWLTVLTALILGLWGLFCAQVVQQREFGVETHEVALPHWPREAPAVRAVVLADPHVARWEGEKLERVVAAIVALQPDVIFMLGDLPYGVVRGLSLPEQEVYAKLAPLAQAAPVFYIIGNHDIYFRRMRPEFRRMGFIPCGENTRRYWFSASQPLDITGFTYSYGPALDDRLPRNHEAAGEVPRVALAHYPESFYNHPLSQVNLILSAHTHGGQLCDSSGLPLFPFGQLTREQTRGGWHKSASGAPLYITRGIGVSRIPLRLNCPSEVTLLLLKGA